MKAANFQKKNSAKWLKELAETEVEVELVGKAVHEDPAAEAAHRLSPPQNANFQKLWFNRITAFSCPELSFPLQLLLRRSDFQILILCRQDFRFRFEN